MNDTSSPSLRNQINENPMSFFQAATIALCTAINMLDGFDVLVMSFAASSVASEWNLAPSDLGILLSAGLVGMAIGSFWIAPYADKIGRRPLVLFCLLLVTVGMLLSAVSQDKIQLSLLRFVTGLGIGGMLAALSALVSEYSSDLRRSFSMSILQSGYPLGAILGGLVSVYLLQQFGWRSLFIFGGSVSLVMIPIVYWKLPESIDFLLLGKRPSALENINRLAKKMKLASISALHTKPIQDGLGYKVLLKPQFLANTVYLWIGYFCLMFAFYFVVSWTPKMLVDAGLSTTQGVSAGIYLQAGGIVGAIIIGLLASRLKITMLTSAYLMMCVISMLVYGFGNLSLIGLMLCASIMGFFLIGAMIGLYAIAPGVYPASHRVTGIGSAIGVGRIGAIIAPFLGGWILEFGVETSQIITVFALPLIVASIAIWQIRLSRTLS